MKNRVANIVANIVAYSVVVLFLTTLLIGLSADYEQSNTIALVINWMVCLASGYVIGKTIK